jgi:hypothetical protein
MAPIDGLVFAGYRSFDAGAEDPFRVKWNAVRIAVLVCCWRGASAPLPTKMEARLGIQVNDGLTA